MKNGSGVTSEPFIIIDTQYYLGIYWGYMKTLINIKMREELKKSVEKVLENIFSDTKYAKKADGPFTYEEATKYLDAK